MTFNSVINNVPPRITDEMATLQKKYYDVVKLNESFELIDGKMNEYIDKKLDGELKKPKS